MWSGVELESLCVCVGGGGCVRACVRVCVCVCVAKETRTPSSVLESPIYLQLIKRTCLIAGKPETMIIVTLSYKISHKSGSRDSSAVRARDSWLKGPRFESLQERQDNFLLQGQLSVLTFVSVYTGAWLNDVHRTCAETAAVSCGTSHVATT